MKVPHRPIVLAHGLAGISQLAVRKLRVATYFRGIPRHLEAKGCRVLAPNLPPLASVETRAKRLRDAVRDAFGDEPVHVVAHSMGGLDARHMISRLGMHDQVLTLVTIGTPHRGSPVADHVFGLAKRLGVLDALRRSGVEHGALDDLRVETCLRRNETTPDAPNVRYFSVVGVKRRDEMMYGLRFTHDVVAPLEGPNDGLVSASSAVWGETLPRWDCDHVNLVGWTGPRAEAMGFARDVRPKFSRLAALLAEAEET